MLRFVEHSVVVGVAYAVANTLVAILLGPLSRIAPSWDNAAVMALTGTLICFCVSPFVLHSALSRRTTILVVWGALALVSSIGTGIEGALFKPVAAASVILGGVIGIVVRLLVAWLVVLLFMPQVERQGHAWHSACHIHGWFNWVWRVVVGGLSYFVFYFVFGAANALLYTKPFYENNPQYGLALPPAGIIFLAQLIRGPLMVLGLGLLAQVVPVARRQLVLWLGVFLFVAAGVAPYLEVTFRTMPLGFNLATLAEIMFQNVLTSIVAAYLFGAKAGLASAEHGLGDPRGSRLLPQSHESL
jgi:hypothetical protein